MRTTRKSIRIAIFFTPFVADSVSEAKQFGQGLVLPDGGQPLLLKVDQTLLVCVDNELAHLQVGAPLVDSMQDGHALFFVGGQPC